MSLYHTEVFVPATLKLPNGTFSLEYSSHAIEQSYRHRERLDLPKFIDTRKATPIEIEADNQNRIQKILYRMELNKDKDIIVVVIPMQRMWLVKTVWANLKTDNHKTLDTSRYARS